MKRINRISDELFETACDLHELGIIDSTKMAQIKELHGASSIPQYDESSVKSIRARLQMCQSALASLMNISSATVKAWELGTKKPSGVCNKLLNLLDRKGIAALL